MLKNFEGKAALIHAFEKTQEDLESNAQEGKCDLKFAGCTGTVMLRHARRNKVWVATVGDSRVAMFIKDKGVAQVIGETRDHKPSIAEEEKRIWDSGGEVRRIDHGDDVIEERVYVKDQQYPGLCMTRSMGDMIVKDCGVTAEPE